MLEVKSMACKTLRNEIFARIIHGRNIAKDIVIDSSDGKENKVHKNKDKRR
jgi:Ribonuclease G/E